jgi:hypothetical protein
MEMARHTKCPRNEIHGIVFLEVWLPLPRSVRHVTDKRTSDGLGIEAKRTFDEFQQVSPRTEVTENHTSRSNTDERL